MPSRTGGPIVGDKLTGELEISGNPTRDFARAVEHHHPCDDQSCDIARALEDGYALWAAHLLLGATECPLVDAVSSYYYGGGFNLDAEAERERVEWLKSSTWTEHAYECGCGAINFGDDSYTPEQCSNCLSTDLHKYEPTGGDE